MKIIIQPVHCTVSEQFHDNLIDKLTTIGQQHRSIHEIKVFLKKENEEHERNYIVEFLVEVPGANVYCSAQDRSFEQAEKTAIHSLLKQIEKHKVAGKDQITHKDLTQ